MEIQKKIEDLKIQVKEVEADYKQKEEVIRKEVGAEVYLEQIEANSKLEKTKKQLENASKNLEKWKEKLPEIKYKFKQTGKGKDTVDEAEENIKLITPRVEKFGEELVVLEGALEKINKALQKRIGTHLKKLEGKKMKIITSLIKEIMSLEKQLEK